MLVFEERDPHLPPPPLANQMNDRNGAWLSLEKESMPIPYTAMVGTRRSLWLWGGVTSPNTYPKLGDA